MTSTPTEEKEEPAIEFESFSPELHKPITPTTPTPAPPPPAPPIEEDEGRSALPVFVATIVLGLAWAGGAAAYLMGYYGVQGLTQGGPERIFGFIFVTFGPTFLIGGLGLVVREMLKFSRTARDIETVATRLSAPLENAKGEARRLADAISVEIDRISETSDVALTRLGAMDEVLRHHAEAVQETSKAARSQVDQMIDDMRTERETINALVDGLGEQAKRISETIERQAEMVSAAADLAGAHSTESRQLLEKAAEHLAAAGGSAQQSGEKAAFAISEQMRDMDALINALDERASRLENVAKSQEGNLKLAQKTAHELSLASEAGSGAMHEASEAAIEQAHRLTEMIEQEMRALAKRASEDVEQIRATADAARMAAEDAGRALENTAATVSAHVDKMSNASNFSGQAEQAFQDRLRQVETMMSRLDDRLAQAPARMARREPPREAPVAPPARRAPPADPFDELEEFAKQHEARRAASRGGDQRGSREAPTDRSSRDNFDDRHPRRDRAPHRGDGHGADRMAPPVDDLPPMRRVAPADMDPTGRRGGGRELRLDDQRPTRGFDRGMDRGIEDEEPRRRSRMDEGDSPGVRMSGGGDTGSWRWKDLLRDTDDQKKPSQRQDGDDVVAGLRRAGVDPNDALDPDMTARIARARRRAGSGEARALVIDSALDDVRRTATALASDPSLRARAEAFIDDHARLVRRAVDQNDARGLGALFDTDTGRAFLLIDAALSDA